jgi:hypothetical protein
MQLLLGYQQERVVSVIRVLPLGGVCKLEQLLERPSRLQPRGEGRPGQLASNKQELANT